MGENGLNCNGFYVIHPMRYHNKLSEDKIRDSFMNNLWCFQEKKDGNFVQVMKQDQEVRIYMRTISRKDGLYVEKGDNVPLIKEWAEEYMPDNTTLLGELYLPGKKSNDCTKILGALPEKAEFRQFYSDKFGGPMYLYIFDCIRYGGESLINVSFADRFSKYVMKVDTIPCKYVSIAKTYSRNPSDGMIYCDDYEEIIDKVFEKGGEGVVFKKLAYGYKPNKRPSDCYKLKEFVDSVDLIIMGLSDPEKEYKGKDVTNWRYWEYKDNIEKEPKRLLCSCPLEYLAGIKDRYTPITKPYFYGWKNALILGAYNNNGELEEIGRVASGLTDEIREALAMSPDEYIGTVVQLSCMSLNPKDKTMRHPVFDCFRPDKNPEECKISEIFSLD